MSDVHELVDPAVRDHQTIAGFWYGIVAGAAPADTLGNLFVIIPDIDPNTLWGPCFWSPRSRKVMVDVSQAPEASNSLEFSRISLPVVGSQCLVVFDNRQNLWVVQWL